MPRGKKNTYIYIYGKLRAVATGLNMITLGLLQWMEECKWHPI